MYDGIYVVYVQCAVRYKLCSCVEDFNRAVSQYPAHGFQSQVNSTTVSFPLIRILSLFGFPKGKTMESLIPTLQNCYGEMGWQITGSAVGNCYNG